ncbi:MAG: hypothetical protein MJY49_02315, partial [Bacteroidales bacterium]|nr:hypothetical protein [Bacteroidales bacterium]
ETIWSWHIWTTNDPALIGEPIHIVNTTPRDYWFFPLYILGWIDSNRYSGTSNDEITLQQRGSGNEIRIAVRRTSVTVTNRSYGTSYQWGRKDPLCTKPDKKPAFGKMPTSTASTVTLQDLVRYPERMPNNVTNWSHYNLWTGRKSVASGSPTDDDEEMIKTIYDPSPVGYKVPGPKAFDRLTKGSDLTHGMYYYTTEDKSATGPTIYFPIPYSWYGLSLMNQWGLYWGSVASNSNNAHYWCANASKYYYAESRAYGQHVRPVRE